MNKLFLIPIIIFSLIFFLFLSRLFLPTQIDDVSPEIDCEQVYLEKSDILWIIPKYNNKPISENQEWCKDILLLNKTLGLHGIVHTYHEFNSEINQEQIQEAINIFENCFNQTPIFFKPPQLKISKENRRLIEDNDMNVKIYWNQLTHKVYHCNNTGKFKNWVIDLF